MKVINNIVSRRLNKYIVTILFNTKEMIIEIEIPVLWHTDETRRFSDLDINYEVDDLEHRNVTFYRIDAVSPNKWDDKHTFCNIHSGGEKWISPMTYEEIKRLIKMETSK